MSESFIRNEHTYGFWVHDDYIQLAIHFICLEIDTMGSSAPDWLIEYSNEWLSLIKSGALPGMSDLRLVDFLDNQKKKTEFSILIEKTSSSLIKRQENISLEELKTIQKSKVPESFKQYDREISVKSVAKVCETLVLLINGHISTKANSSAIDLND